MSFDTEVSLSLTVSQRELRSVRSEIEGGLGDIEMGVSGGGSRGAARADGGNRNRRLFRWARQRTRDMDTTVTLLESIDDTLDESGGSLLGGRGGGGINLPFIIPGRGVGGSRTPRPGSSGRGGLFGTAARVGAGAAILPMIASELMQAGRSDVEGGEEGFSAALTASPLFQLFSAGVSGASAAEDAGAGGNFLDTMLGLGDSGGGESQMQFQSIPEPAWLNTLERIMGQDLRVTIDGQVQTDVSGGIARATQEEIADQVIDDVRDEFEGDLDDLKRQIVSGIGRGSQGSQGRISPG